MTNPMPKPIPGPEPKPKPGPEPKPKPKPGPKPKPKPGPEPKPGPTRADRHAHAHPIHIFVLATPDSPICGPHETKSNYFLCAN